MRLLHRDRMNPEQADVDGAERVESNRETLIRTDPDAARILHTSAIDSVHSWKASATFASELKEYAAIKNAAGRLDLYNQLFQGI